MIDEQLVQLLSPEGERISNPDYESTLTGDEIFDLYRDMVIIRRLCNESTSLQRQGQLALWAPIQGQEAAQIGAGTSARAEGLLLPLVPRTRRRLVSRGAARGHAAGLSRGHDRRLGPSEVPSLGAHGRPGQPDAARRGLRDGHPARRRRGGRLTFFGDGASSQGDVLESFVWAASLQRPGRVPVPEQPVGASRRPPRCSRRSPSTTAPTASASPACASTATTCSRCTR